MEKINLFVVFNRTQEYYDNPLELPNEDRRNYENLIGPKLKEWDKFFTLPWWEFRKRLTEITFMDVDKWRVEGIINWFNLPLIKSLSTLPGKNYIIQLDDDDWLHPQLFIDLRSALQKKEYSTICWNAIEITPDFRIRGLEKFDKPVVNHKRLLKITDVDKLLTSEEEDWAALWGGMYGFNLAKRSIDLLGKQHPNVHQYLKLEKKQGRTLTLTKQPYMYRNFHPGGRGWFMNTNTIDHSVWCIKNHRSFLANFDGETIGFKKQIEAYKQIVDTLIK